MKKMAQKKYVDGSGYECPACRNDNVVHDCKQADFDGKKGWMPVKCDNCNATWTEDYKLIGYSDLEVPSPLIKTPIGILDGFTDSEQVAILEAARLAFSQDSVPDKMDMGVGDAQVIHERLSEELNKKY